MSHAYLQGITVLGSAYFRAMLIFKNALIIEKIRYIYPERGVQRGRYGIGHVLQIISDPPPYTLLALCRAVQINMLFADFSTSVISNLFYSNIK